MTDNAACNNTDREIWRGPDEGNGSYYADSIHVTEGGGVGINCGGRVIVMPLRDWHALGAKRSEVQSKTPGSEFIRLAELVENGQRLVMSHAYRIVLTDAEVDTVAAGLRSVAQEAGDPLAGLVERLDRLCLTSTENNRVFVLATESAKNIVEIVREWIRSGSGRRHSVPSAEGK